MFDVWGFGCVWVGLGHGSISSPGSGLGWVGSGSVIWWVGLGWVDENRPTDNCASKVMKNILRLKIMNKHYEKVWSDARALHKAAA